MNYNIKWFEVEVLRGKAQNGIPEYLRPDLKPETPNKREPRSPLKDPNKPRTG